MSAAKPKRPPPDRDAFARRYLVPLLLLFGACLVLGLLRGNVLAIIGGVGGLGWLAWAHFGKAAR
ncbi:MAG: hypothetical protein AAF371_15810 [Pseudomonadota bacterium]